MPSPVSEKSPPTMIVSFALDARRRCHQAFFRCVTFTFVEIPPRT